MDFYPFSVAVGQTQHVPVSGAYVRFGVITAGSAYPRVVVKTGQGRRVILWPGKSARIGAFGELEIQNYDGQNTITGLLEIAEDGEDITDNRINGAVDVVDGGKNKVLASQAFNWDQTVAAVVAQYGHNQLWNPSGSGKNLIVSGLQMSLNAAAVCYLGRLSSALTTAGANPISNLLGDTSACVGLGKKQNDAAQLASIDRAKYIDASNTFIPFEIGASPIVIPPGQGLVTFTSLTNSAFSTIAQVTQEPI